MADNISSFFSGDEIQKRRQIVSLMEDWKSEIARNYDPEYWEEGNPISNSYFISDGFFPGYYNQEIKVLFIGRETRFMYEEGDWVHYMIKHFETDNQNNKLLARRLLYIVHGIRSKGKLEFEDVKRKTADGIAKEIKDHGFAFMDISKYSNINKDKPDADYHLINQFLKDSNLEKINYFQKEIEILNPDIIITLNLWNGKIDQKYLDLCFGKIEWEKINDDIDGKVNVSNIILNGKNIKLLNTYSFTDYSHSDKEYFYDPVMEILFK
jgi:hypothetical protein